MIEFVFSGKIEPFVNFFIGCLFFVSGSISFIRVLMGIRNPKEFYKKTIDAVFKDKNLRYIDSPIFPEQTILFWSFLGYFGLSVLLFIISISHLSDYVSNLDDIVLDEPYKTYFLRPHVVYFFPLFYLMAFQISVFHKIIYKQSQEIDCLNQKIENLLSTDFDRQE